jgi:NADH-quinone oxidoreductase subunit L
MPHGQIELFLVGAAVAIGALGLLAGWWATLRRPILPADAAAADTGFARILFRKYYVDEIYDALIVRPVVWLSRFVLWKGVDQGVVDGAAVNGSARLSRGLGWLGSQLQTGQVGVYVVLFLVGALWILRVVIR